MDPRTWFATAATGLVDVVQKLRSDQLSLPALGDWDVRSLLGHTSRAFLTIESYLRADGDPELSSPEDYFRATRAGLADPAQVTERGRDAGTSLGADPAAAVTELAHRVTDLVERTPDDAVVGTPAGRMTLLAYLPTRAFELTVHGIDLARACDQTQPAGLLECVAEAVALCGRIAGPDQQLQMLLALTGRSALPSGFSAL